MTKQHLDVPATSASPERLFSSVGLVKSDWRGRFLETTLIDVMSDRGLYTYMTSYLAQTYRLSIIIDKSTLLSIVD